MRPLLFSFLFCSLSIFTVNAQLRARAPRDFQITKINKDFVTTPDYGNGPGRAGVNGRWLEVEAEFNSAADWTEELTVKYYILFNGRLLTGEVTHVNIPGGLNRSVMYVLPVALARFSGNRPLLPNTVQNIAIQILQGGALKDELSVVRSIRSI